jgi:hypothetical protein
LNYQVQRYRMVEIALMDTASVGPRFQANRAL